MSSEPSTHLSLSLSGVCVCQPVFLSVYITVSTSSIDLSASSQLFPHFLPTISIAPAPGPHVSVILWSCNGCNSSTLSRYFTYSSAIAVDDSAKMSCKLVVQDAAVHTSFLFGVQLHILYLSNVYRYIYIMMARTLKKYMVHVDIRDA